MCGKIFKVFIVIACAVAFCVEGFGIGMADKDKTLLELCTELNVLCSFFFWDSIAFLKIDKMYDFLKIDKLNDLIVKKIVR